MKCPKCKKGTLFFMEPPEGETRGSTACDNMECDYHVVPDGYPSLTDRSPEDIAHERDGHHRSTF